MATLREIKGRITAVENTKKITKTMEMISTAKAKKAVDRVQAAQPYAWKIDELIRSIAGLNVDSNHPLLRKPTVLKKIGILVITGNRGLCGGFNNNVTRLAIESINRYKSEGKEVDIHLIGKKAISSFKFQKIQFNKSYTHIDDKSGIKEAVEFAEYFMKEYEAGRLDFVEIFYTKYFNASRQNAVSKQVLPFPLEKGTQKGGSTGLFEPGADQILAALLPKAIRVLYLQSLLESAASEQIARRIAMKSATDSASDMIKGMTRLYNRARQSKITQEISEIIAGADSIG